MHVCGHHTSPHLCSRSVARQIASSHAGSSSVAFSTGLTAAVFDDFLLHRVTTKIVATNATTPSTTAGATLDVDVEDPTTPGDTDRFATLPLDDFDFDDDDDIDVDDDLDFLDDFGDDREADLAESAGDFLPMEEERPPVAQDAPSVTATVSVDNQPGEFSELKPSSSSSASGA